MRFCGGCGRLRGVFPTVSIFLLSPCFHFFQDGDKYPQVPAPPANVPQRFFSQERPQDSHSLTRLTPRPPPTQRISQRWGSGGAVCEEEKSGGRM
jgi:hypothetical protein